MARIQPSSTTQPTNHLLCQSRHSSRDCVGLNDSSLIVKSCMTDCTLLPVGMYLTVFRLCAVNTWNKQEENPYLSKERSKQVKKYIKIKTTATTRARTNYVPSNTGNGRIKQTNKLALIAVVIGEPSCLHISLHGCTRLKATHV